MASGFGGELDDWDDLRRRAGWTPPAAWPRLPFDRMAGPGAAGVEVCALVESQGPVERLLRRLRRRLAEGGALLMDVANSQGLTALRAALEGRPRGIEPAGVPCDAERALPRRRLVQAVVDAGFVLRECAAVAGSERLEPSLPRALLAQGVLPFAYVDGAPPARFWLWAEARRPLAGTVLIGAGTGADQERTAGCVRAYLPEGWEVVCCPGDGRGEAVAFDAAVPGTSGDRLWLLRAGASPDRAWFHALLDAATLSGAAMPAGDVHDGDVSGLMVLRRALFAQPPMCAHHRQPLVAYEAWRMRADATEGVAGVASPDGRPFPSPPPPVTAGSEQLATECEQLMHAWHAVGLDDARGGLATGGAPPPPPPWSGREPTVSLCMITRDESERLPRCLQSVRDCVDEIVIVDTGSTDATVAIAESWGARVAQQPWADDFSAPRNLAIELATGDWILVLDADEHLAAGQAAAVRELTRDPTAAGYQLDFHNLNEAGKTVPVSMLRLFRRLPGLRYRNRIHEQVLPSLKRIAPEHGLTIRSSSVVVLHDGYTAECIRDRDKDRRNERLFRMQIAEHPDDLYCLYKFGDFVRRIPGGGAESTQLLRRAWHLLQAASAPPSEVPYAGEVAALLALDLTRAGHVVEAERIVATALTRFMPTPNLHYVAANVALAQGRTDVARAHWRACTAYRGQVLVVPVQDGITSHVALLGMAQASLLDGDLARARELVEQARRIDPAGEAVALASSALLLQSGEVQRALTVLTHHLAGNPQAAGACHQAAIILERLGHAEHAHALASRAAALHDDAGRGQESRRVRQLLSALEGAQQPATERV